jgi:uncharacterized protein (TIGR02099 family)
MVMLKRALHICWWAAAAVLVTLALALSAVRLLLPTLPDYRAQIETIATDVVKRPVSVGSLDAAWHLFSPVLKLEQVVVRDPKLPGGALVVDEVEVALDLVDSLLQRRWRTAGVRVIGTRLTLETDVRHSTGQFPLQTVLDWLLTQDSVALEDVHLTWNDPGLFAAAASLDALSVRLVNAGHRHQALLSGTLPDALGRTVKIAADLYGDGNDIGQWRGTLYLKAAAVQLAAFQPALAGSGVLASGNANLELWLGVRDARPVWGSGSLDWQKPQVNRVGAPTRGRGAASRSANFHWRRHQDIWRIGVDRFAVQRDKRAVWPVSRFDLVAIPGDELRVSGTASLLVLDELRALVPLLPWVSDTATGMLERSRPGGRLRDAEFEYRQQAGESPDLALRASFEDLSLAAHDNVPGLTGVTGRIEGNLLAGRLQLDGAQGQLVMPHVFPQPLALSRVDGEVSWQRFGDRIRVGARHLRIESGVLRVDSRWQMDWLYDQPAPWLDAQLAVNELPLTAIGDYLPSGVMSPAAVRWLQQAFHAGRARNARVLLQGRLDQLPFDRHQGRLEARFDFTDTRLDYHADWGQLEDLSGTAVFNGRSLHITGDRGRIQDSPVERVVAVIDDLKTPWLKVDGTVDGTLEGMLQYVRSSALKERFGRLAENLAATGDARLQLQLAIPLIHRLGKTRVNGDIVLAGNDLLPTQGGPGLTDISGRLRFSREGISVKDAAARLLGQPVTVAVYRSGESPSESTVVDVQGRLKLVELAKQKAPVVAPWLDGNTPWQVLLKVRHGAPANVSPVSVELHSELRGVAVTLPAPFNKSADEALPVTIGWAPGQEFEQPVRVRYGDRLDASLLLGPDRRLRKAGVRFGAGAAALPERDEVHLSGALPVLDLGQWRAVFDALENTAKGTAAVPLSVDLGADLLRLGALRISAVHALSKSADPWYFRFDGEGAGGWLRWVPGGGARPARLLAKLDHLHLAVGATAEDPVTVVKLQPDALPELDVDADDVRLGQRDFGHLTVVSQRTATGAHFQTLKMQSPALSFAGSGDWLLQAGVQSSRIDVKISDGQLEKLSELFDGSRAIKGGTLKGRVQASWPGAPTAFSLSRLEAQLDLEARDGRLENVDEGAGKLLSLISLNSLQRRLKLDFRDVVKEGFSFDHMQGRFTIMDGDAFTDDFTIDGTSVKIDISGRTGLVARDYEQLVSVTPQVSSTLPIAGAIAGGPAVGAAVYLADKLVGDRFNRLTQVQYRVTGSWDDPVYTRLKRNEPDN